MEKRVDRVLFREIRNRSNSIIFSLIELRIIFEVAGGFGSEVSTRCHPDPSKPVTKSRYSCVKTGDHEKKKSKS